MRDQPVSVSRSAFMARRSVTEICAATSLKRLQRLGFRQRAFAEAERADQRAMHDQVAYRLIGEVKCA